MAEGAGDSHTEALRLLAQGGWVGVRCAACL